MYLFAVLRHARDIPWFEQAQRRGEWAYRHPPRTDDTRVAVLGLGELGACAAHELQRQGLTVLGWSRSPRAIDGVQCHAGTETLDAVIRLSRHPGRDAAAHRTNARPARPPAAAAACRAARRW